MTQTEIRRLTSKPEIYKVVKLMNKSLGAGYCSTKEYMKTDKFYIHGLFVGRFMVGADVVSALENDLDNLHSYFLDSVDRPLGYYESVAIVPKYRGKGLGQKLIAHGVECLEQQGFKDIVALCWNSGQLNQESLPVFKKAGFVEVEHFPQPWEGSPCPVCGPNCHCNATLVYLKLGA